MMDGLVSATGGHGSRDMLHHRRHGGWEILPLCSLIESGRQLWERGTHLLLELLTCLAGDLLDLAGCLLGRLLGLLLELAGLLLKLAGLLLEVRRMALVPKGREAEVTIEMASWRSAWQLSVTQSPSSSQ
jgi:hypothetical protein